MRLSTSSELITWLTGSWVLGPGQHVAQRAVAVVGRIARRLAEREVAVERHVLLARGRLDGGDDLPRDAELGEAAERGQAVVAVVADRLVEAEHALLDEVLGVAAGQEVRARLEAHELVIAQHERVERRLIAAAIRLHEREVGTLTEGLRVVRRPRTATVVGLARHSLPPPPLVAPAKPGCSPGLRAVTVGLLRISSSLRKVSGSTLSSSREGIVVDSRQSQVAPASRDRSSAPSSRGVMRLTPARAAVRCTSWSAETTTTATRPAARRCGARSACRR